ncbi:MAG TPA: acyltransferase [Chitinophagaceae bacterium]
MKTTSSSPGIHKHYPALDGLRGIAIILVLLYHNFNFIEYFNYGWLGVDLFFVLSGFLITNILLNSLTSEKYFRNFYTRRVLRIFPLYYFSLILFLFIIPAINPSLLEMSYYKEHQVWFWTYLQNWPLIIKSDESGVALNHYWSLAMEEQYYLLWPLIILLLKNPKRILIFCIFLLVIVIAARFYIWENNEHFPSYERAFLFTRLDGILIGSMLAAIYKINIRLLRKYFTVFLVTLTAVNYLFYLYKENQSPDFPVWAIGGFTTFSFVFALGVYEAVMKENKFINLVFTNPVLMFLGKYSYGIYIFHWPITIMMTPYFGDIMRSLIKEPGVWRQMGIAILCTVTAVVISVISYHFFEKHFLKFKKYF